MQGNLEDWEERAFQGREELHQSLYEGLQANNRLIAANRELVLANRLVVFLNVALVAANIVLAGLNLWMLLR